MKKRDFLKIVGGGAIVAATPGCAVLQPTPQQALSPWLKAGTEYNEPRRKALSYAILCPNPHNRQPWMVDLSVENQVSVYVDPDRQLPHTDPFARQITIGLGCFIELMAMAAAVDGWDVDISAFPEGSDPNKLLDDRPVAVARFAKSNSVQTDPLFEQVRNRHSFKTPFDMTKPVPNDAITAAITAAKYGSRAADGNFA